MAKKEEPKKVADDVYADFEALVAAANKRDRARELAADKKAENEKEAARVKSAQTLAKAMADEQDRRIVEWHHQHLGSLSDSVFRDTVRKLYGFDP